MQKTKNKQHIIFLCFLVLSFVGCFIWYFYSDFKAKNIQKRFLNSISYIYNNIQTQGESVVSKGDSVVAWTDNTIAITDEQTAKLNNEWNKKVVVELKNGFFLHKSVSKTSDSIIHYLYLIKHNYDSENLYLKNTFSDAFNLDKNIEIVFYKTEFPIVFQGNTICYLEASPECLEKNETDTFIFNLWLIINLFLLGIVTLNSRSAVLFIRNKIITSGNKSLVTLIIFVMYAIFCIIWVQKNPISDIQNPITNIKYSNILTFSTLTLFGFLVFLTLQNIYSKNKNKSYSPIKQFICLLVIATISGSVLQVFSSCSAHNDKNNSIATENTKNNDYDFKNFTLLMRAATIDSTLNEFTMTKNFQKAEDYIEKYYLSLLNQSFHTSVLIFSDKDSMILQPSNRYVNILSYIKERLKSDSVSKYAINNEELSESEFFKEQIIDNTSCLFFHKADGYYLFAECLQKFNNRNMNYSLFLDDSLTSSSEYQVRQHFSLYQLFSCVSLIFLLLTILFGIWKIIVSIPNFRKKTLSIKSKILASLLGSFLLSVLILGIFSINTTINLNNQNNANILKEKTQSIAFETDKILNFNDTITNMDLINLSNTFLTDINIFDINGNLIATSQEDIFNRGIISEKIDPSALNTIKHNPDTLFYHQESICKGNFLASYITQFNNSNNQYLIINVPFINQQKIMTDNINDLANNFANMFLFWINVAVLIFVFLSNIITKPLEILKQKMTKINVNTHNDKILWDKDDEMGQLINSFNLMIDKIEESTLLLKQQERLSSWRELAKQVAHDINNPLTPMKLSIQYLQRLKNNKPESFDEKFNEIAPSLISQIESISTITQELNSYSRPSAKKEKVNLDECITSAINLFATNDDVSISYEGIKHAVVIGESKLFIRIFNNLIKNSIQALYNTKEGKIKISISESDTTYTVAVRDNGCGIKDEHKNNIFNTQFTTKENGNGIGLTIVKTILENYDATISFRSKEHVGTVFFIEFPKLKS